MSQTYSLIFQNNSSNAGDVCVYQQAPDLGVPNVMSLAWFAKYTFPTTQVQFSWQINYNFVWSQTGVLVPGVMFIASQSPSANLSSSNQITLDYQQSAYEFTNQTVGAEPGSLYITETQNIPLSQAAVGIGMSGVGTFVVQAQPNLNLVFTPHPTYWITFGTYQPGQVLDIEEINNPAQITFPPNVYSMTAILQPDNTWTVQPTQAINAALVNARKSNSLARWGAL